MASNLCACGNFLKQNKAMCRVCERARNPKEVKTTTRKRRSRAKYVSKPGPTLSEQLASLGFADYATYLASSLWQDFRKTYFASCMPRRCLLCGRFDVSLHHVTYARLGCEKLKDVVPLCQPHHDEVHAWLKANKQSVSHTNKAIKEIAKTLGIPKADLHSHRKYRKPDKVEVNSPETSKKSKKPSRHLLERDTVHRKGIGEYPGRKWRRSYVPSQR